MVGGRIRVGGLTWMTITAENQAASTVRVTSLAIPFSLHDDDIDALLPASTNALHPIYENAYRKAYIEPVLIQAKDSELPQFQANIQPSELSNIQESEFEIPPPGIQNIVVPAPGYRPVNFPKYHYMD